ncbi:hypothetical protein [Aeromonas phage Aer_P220]|uniref:Uncharacterized protein n=1 Tax=Aeromonas phage Aer_P220 TaxID=2951227 RepID=A0A9E7NNG0_9CAUD|nr:hypothetical protein [Aeromonas phage Aer_P220]
MAGRHMQKFYVEVSEYKYEDYTSYTVSLGFVVVYAKGEDEAHELASRLYAGLTLGWPTTEEPS